MLEMLGVVAMAFLLCVALVALFIVVLSAITKVLDEIANLFKR